jgi:triosephosphate isomerase
MRIVGANWKMNLTIQEAQHLYTEIQLGIPNSVACKVIIFVPQPFLSSFNASHQITVGAQNFYAPELSGPYTGETSLLQLKSMNVITALVGHSERRQYFSETNESAIEKAALALKHGFNVVFCCGEPKEIRLLGEQEVFNYLESQLHQLMTWNSEQRANLVLAYEPIWAIGTGKLPLLDEINSVHAFLKEKCNVPVIYGGSCDAENSKDILSLPNVDGVLIGGASLNASSFLKILQDAC